MRSVKGNKTANEKFLNRVPVICLSSRLFLFSFFNFFSIKIVIIISSFPREAFRIPNPESLSEKTRKLDLLAFWIPNPFLKRLENWIYWRQKWVSRDVREINKSYFTWFKFPHSDRKNHLERKQLHGKIQKAYHKERWVKFLMAGFLSNLSYLHCIFWFWFTYSIFLWKKLLYKLSLFVFADDTNLFCSDKDVKNKLDSMVNDELSHVQKWLRINRLTLNVKNAVLWYANHTTNS